jgi:hypothetical protein
MEEIYSDKYISKEVFKVNCDEGCLKVSFLKNSALVIIENICLYLKKNYSILS